MKNASSIICSHLFRGAIVVLPLFSILIVIPHLVGQRADSGRSQLSDNASGAVAISPSMVLPVQNASPNTPGPWSIGMPYPITVVRYGFAQTATHFYVFGGVSNGTRVNNVNRMNISTGVWESRAPMPFSSEAPTCALMATTSLVYCTEGDTGSGFASYNIATDTWTPLASIPGGDHYGSASGAFNGKVFVVGGTTGIVNTVQVYDVASNTWSAGAAAPAAFLLAGYRQVGQYLYVIGGWDATSPNSDGAQSSVLRRGRQPNASEANKTTSYRLDMTSGVWSTGPAFTQSRADFGLAYDSGTNTLYALGGDATGGGFFDSTNLVDELPLATWPAGTWVASPPNLTAPNRQANQAGFFGGGQIWSVGGLVGSTFQFLSEVQYRANASCTTGSAWAIKAPYPIILETPSVASNGTFIYAAGGSDGTTFTATHVARRYDPTANSWSALPDLPTAVFATRGVYAANTNAFYVFGGYTGSAVLSTVQKYDIASNSWSNVAPMPDVRVFPNVAYYAATGKIYVIGGSIIQGGNQIEQSQTWEYDPVANTWNTSRAPIPVAMAGSATSISGQFIYLAGNLNGGFGSMLHYRYDITNNSWTTKASLPANVFEAAGASVNNRNYVIGGGNPSVSDGSKSGLTALRSPTASYNTTYIYDIASNTWSNGPNTNVAHSYTAGTSVGGTLYVLAGFNGTNDTGTLESLTVFCPCTQAWQNEPPMTTARRNAATAVVAPNLYAITGFDSVSPYVTTNEQFNGTTWTTRAPIPIRHAQGRATALGSKIYVPGGFNSTDFGGALDTMQIYNTLTDTWSPGANLPAARSGVATAAFNGSVYVIAGYNPVGTGHNEVYIYNPITNTYTTGASMPATQGNAAGVLLNNEIYVVGGGTAPGAHYAYNPTSNTWRTIAPIPTTGGTCQSNNGFVLDNELWVVGCLGLAINQQVWIYNSGTDTWRTGSLYNVDHQGPGAVSFNGRGFVVGGGAASGGSTAVESISSCAPAVSSAVSRKTHTGVGPFDVNLPLTDTPGIECRTGGGTNDFTMIVTFASPVAVTGSPQAQLTSGTGCVGTGGVCNGGVVSVSGAVVTIPLTNIADDQTINVTLNGVSDGTAIGSVVVPMTRNAGDTNGNGAVNSSDVGQTKGRIGQAVTATNFRSDVNASGGINSTDVSIIKQNIP